MKTSLVIVMLIAGAASADNKSDAKLHKQKAAAAYKDKQWPVVLDELNQANALDPDPNLNFSIGQVYAKMDKCSEAIHSYEAFLASKPPTDNANVAQEAIDACKKILADKLPEVAPKPAPIVVQPQPVERKPRWYDDRRGVALVGGGSAALIVGVAFYIAARSTLSDAEAAPTYGEQADKYGSAKTQRTVGVVFGLAGAALVGVGVYHYVNKSKQERRVGLAPVTGGGLVTYASGF